MENLKNTLKHLFQQKQKKDTPLVKNIKTYRTDLKELKLEVLMFTHFMYEDDDKLSLLEKRSIMNMVREESESIPEAVELQFKEWIHNPPSLGYILDYAKKNEYTYEDIDNAILVFVKHTDQHSRYHKIIRSVRKKLLLEKEYLKK